MAENQFLALLQKEEPSIKAILPDYIGRDRWWALAYEVSRSADLQRIAQSNPASLIAALKKVADWGLDLDGEEAFIIPYGDSAEAQSGYKGLIRRAVEASVAVHIYAELVREGEEFTIVSGSHRELRHVPTPLAKGKQVIGAYAVAILANGLTDFEIFNEEDIAAVQSAALRMAQRRKKDAGESPAWRFFRGQMIKKSVIRRLCQRLKGKRDSDAGRRYAEITRTERSFDAETTSQELPPDDLPQGVDNADVAQRTEQPVSTGTVAGSTPAIGTTTATARRHFNDDEANDLMRRARKRGLGAGDVALKLGEEFDGRDDPCALFIDELSQAEKALGL